VRIQILSIPYPPTEQISFVDTYLFHSFIIILNIQRNNQPEITDQENLVVAIAEASALLVLDMGKPITAK
jgi:hypothetical protein